jgi:hypothetical protein
MKLLKTLPFIWICLLTACAPTTPPPPFPPPPGGDFLISVQTDASAYAINEKATVRIQSTRDCYLNLYDITPADVITQIFPNRFASDNLILAHRTYQIPDPADKFDLVVTGPTGTEVIWAVCTLDDTRLLPDDLVDRGGEFPRIKSSRAEFNKAVTRNLAIVPRDRKAEATTTFRVIRSRY